MGEKGVVCAYRYSMGFITFQEYVQLREGLWLADKNAVPSMSRINPFPTTLSRLKPVLGKRAVPSPTKPTFMRLPPTPSFRTGLPPRKQ